MTDHDIARGESIGTDRCPAMTPVAHRWAFRPGGGRVQAFLRLVTAQAAAGSTRRPRAVASALRRAPAARDRRRPQVTAGAGADHRPRPGTRPHCVPYWVVSTVFSTPRRARSCGAITARRETTGLPSCPASARISKQRGSRPVPARRAVGSRRPVSGPYGSSRPAVGPGLPSPWRG